jgi:hypothetical protein
MAGDDRYRAFAEWRLTTHRKGKGRSVRFFRLTRDHTVIWSTVMRGHYAGAPPTIRECIAEVRCSKETARRIILLAQARGYFQIRSDDGDARKRLVAPSRQCVAEYEAMVDGYLELPDILGVRPSRSGNRPKN